jgi:polyketide cyclase/dehydrase/lipid transport protein
LGELTRQTAIEASEERVFEYASNPYNAPRYISSITEVTSGPEGSPEVGNEWQAKGNFLGQPARLILKLSRLERPHTIGFMLIGEPQAKLTLRIGSSGRINRARVSISLEVPSIPTLFLEGLMGGLLSGDMARLKSIMEAEGANHAGT